MSDDEKINYEITQEDLDDMKQRHEANAMLELIKIFLERLIRESQQQK
jgi:hypothetical protein